MRKDFGAITLMYPMPVLIVATYDKEGNPNAMNAAWGGIADTNMISLCLSPEHKTVENLVARKAFTVSMGTLSQMTACDYVGIVSQNKDKDKFKKTKWTVTKSSFVDAPVINELPLTLECKLTKYDKATGMLLASIENVCADEGILNETGKIDVKKLEPITFDSSNSKYIKLGDVVGDAFACGLKLAK